MLRKVKKILPIPCKSPTQRRESSFSVAWLVLHHPEAVTHGIISQELRKKKCCYMMMPPPTISELWQCLQWSWAALCGQLLFKNLFFFDKSGKAKKAFGYSEWLTATPSAHKDGWLTGGWVAYWRMGEKDPASWKTGKDTSERSFRIWRGAVISPNWQLAPLFGSHIQKRPTKKHCSSKCSLLFILQLNGIKAKCTLVKRME